MGYRLYPGDGCPKCGERLSHYTRSIWTLFLRQSHLRCSRCGLSANKRPAHRITDYHGERGRRQGRWPRSGIFNDRIDIELLLNRKFPVLGIAIAGLLLAALIYSRDDIVSFAARTFEQATEEGLAQKVVDATVPALSEQQTQLAAPEPLIPLPFEVAAREPVSLRAELLPPLPVIAVTPPVSLRAELLPQSVQAQAPSGRRYGLQNRNSRITLRVHRPTIVAIRDARNRIFIDRKLAPGDTYRVPNLVGLWLTAIDASAVELILDGASVGFTGAQSAAVRDLSLNPQSIADRARRTSS